MQIDCCGKMFVIGCNQKKHTRREYLSQVLKPKQIKEERRKDQLTFRKLILKNTGN